MDVVLQFEGDRIICIVFRIPRTVSAAAAELGICDVVNGLCEVSNPSRVKVNPES